MINKIKPYVNYYPQCLGCYRYDGELDVFCDECDELVKDCQCVIN